MFRGEESPPAGRRRSVVAGEMHGARKSVVVLGMHRSGTSVFTGMLALLGCGTPSTLLGAAASNPTGHWESAAITAFDDALLDTLHSSWRDWSPIDLSALPAAQSTALLEAAVDLLKNEYGHSKLICLKDPRLCRLAPFWLAAFERAKIEPVFALPIRNPAEVAASLAARDGMARTDAVLLWLRHVLEAEWATRGRRRVFVSYVHLLEDWRAVASELEVRLGIEWPRGIRLAAAEIDDLVQGRHRHHTLPVGALDCPEPLRQWAGTCCEVFGRWQEAGESRAEYRLLDAVRAEFDRSTMLASALLALDRAELGRLRVVEADLARERTAREASEATAKALIERQARMTAGIIHAYDRLPRMVSGPLTAGLVERTGIVDGPWYLRQNADVARQGMSPARHFARFGYAEGRRPAPLPDLPGGLR